MVNILVRRNKSDTSIDMKPAACRTFGLGPRLNSADEKLKILNLK